MIKFFIYMENILISQKYCGLNFNVIYLIFRECILKCIFTQLQASSDFKKELLRFEDYKSEIFVFAPLTIIL